MKKLTEKQKQILKLIADKVKDVGFPPTMQELADELGVKSKNAIFKHLEALEKKGYIRRAAGGARGITILESLGFLDSAGLHSVPLVGSVAAGSPILAEENIERYVPVPNYLTQNGGDYFALRVKGDSMIEAGILDGDLVIVRSTPYAENGDIVVALSGEEATVKRLLIQGSQKFLKPENEMYELIPLTEEWSIIGKVVSLIRERL
ncbi:MAG: transcriptional repressor LexA [candidate division KSB1 bacterium]|nr:transcriptional repressor LexA [candidate division KSB1 bacterium]MDQ7064846.1 transcriptional repressor LexA [candidate division KSB1 bacterium]